MEVNDYMRLPTPARRRYDLITAVNDLSQHIENLERLDRSS